MLRLKRHPLRFVFLATVFAPLLLGLAVGWWQSSMQSQVIADQVERRLFATARSVAVAADNLPDVERLARTSQTRVMLVGTADGNPVLADSQQQRTGESLAARPEIYTAMRESGLGRATEIIDGVRHSIVAVHSGAARRTQPVTAFTGDGHMGPTDAAVVSETQDSAADEFILWMATPTFAVTGDSTRNYPPGLLQDAAWFWSLIAIQAIALLLAAISGRSSLVVIRSWMVRLTQQLEDHSDDVVRQAGAADDSPARINTSDRIRLAARHSHGELADELNRKVERLQQELRDQTQLNRVLQGDAQFLQTVLGAMLEGVIAVDSEFRIQFANAASATLLGSNLSPQKMAGRQVLEVIRHQTVQTCVREVLAGSAHCQDEFELPRVGRRILLFVSRLTGQTSGAVMVLHDVTELRRLENMRREFVSNVSHELKTPLASIRAYAETLLDGALRNPETCERFVVTIQQQADRLNELIEDVMQLARIESGHEAFQPTDVHVSDAIHAVAGTYAAIAQQRSIEITLQELTPQLHVHIDARGFRTILDNLISNAVKYTPDSGRVTVQWQRAGGDVRIDVVDTGVGIPAEHQSRIFERFYRVDEARARDVGGTGLGLSIVKHLTQEFGGRIEVTSAPGQGSRFTITLPAAARSKSARGQE